VPVLCGSAFKNKGVQPLLDAIIDYLPSPLDMPPVCGAHPSDKAEAERQSSPSELTLGAFMWRLAQLEGVAPEVSCCVKCRSTTALAALDLLGGGLVCSQCETPGLRRLSPQALGLLQEILGGGLAAALARPAPPGAAEVEALGIEVLERHIETRVRVEHVLEPLTFRIYPDATAGEIQHLMLRRGLQVVPVVGRAHELLGVIESGDLLRNILPRRDTGSACGNRNRKDLSARDIMTRSILCVSEREDLATASHSLVSRGMSRLPVVTNGRLVGFVSRETVMRAFADAFPTTRPPKRIEPY